MATYKYGSRGDDVKDLQTKLNEKGGYALETDGIYGAKTEAAVRDYQTQNNLTVDGIAGDETQGHLNGASASGSSQTKSPVADTPSTVQQAAQKKLSTLQKGYSSPLDETIDTLYDKILGQKEFEYDPYADPTYNQYAEIYKKNAALMSEDVMAQAAELTGGYGSSYAQAVASQAYNEQMSELNDIVPELRQNAYNEWQDARARDIENVSLLLNERDYDRSIFESDRAFDEGVRQFDEGLALDKESFEYQKQQDAINLALDKERLDWQKQQYNDERDMLALEAGYSSWDEYVDAVGKGEVVPTEESVETDKFSLSEVQDAEKTFKSNGINGLQQYISQLEQTGKNYSDEQFYSLMFNATGLDTIGTYDQAINWIVNNSVPDDNGNMAMFAANSTMKAKYKFAAEKVLKSEAQWKNDPEYNSYPEYLRYSLIDIISSS